MDKLTPSAFISHGAPTLALEDCDATQFLSQFTAHVGQPSGIVVISAHWTENEIQVTTSESLPLIYDFYGFPKPLYELEYPAHTSRDIADKVLTLLNDAAIPAKANNDRGLDHGAWVPLRLMFPNAEIPVIQVSMAYAKPDVYHLRVGRALAALRQQGVLIIGSGSVTHNLGDCVIKAGETDTRTVPAYAKEFTEWIAEHVAANDDNALLSWRQNAPYAKQAHPSDEHFIPFFVALGAAGLSWHGERIHKGYMHHALAMDAYLFTHASTEAGTVNH